MCGAKVLAPMFAIAAIILANSPLRAVAQDAVQTNTASNHLATTSDEGVTSELSAAQRRVGGGGGGRSVSRGGGGGRSISRGGGGGRSVSRGSGRRSVSHATSSGKSKSVSGGGKSKSVSGGGKSKSVSGGGTGKNASGGGASKLGNGPGKNGGGSGKNAGGGPGKKIGSGPGKKGAGPNKLAGGAGGGPGVIRVDRGPRRLWFGGRWVTFVGFGTLAALMIDSDYYYPYGYVSIARPWCSGITAEGCRLHWQSVALEEGGEQVQCVQYCSRRVTEAAPTTGSVSEAVPSVAAVSLASVPPQPRGQCEVVIYAESGLKGLSVPTSEDQPALEDAGWKNEIASLEVKSGTWDFFTDDNYAGATMRLAPGSYGELGADWVKKISSFNCSNPAP